MFRSPGAGSKRPAASPTASPSKAATKRSRTHYDYYDEEDVETSAEEEEDDDEEQWSDEDLETSSRMSLDDPGPDLKPLGGVSAVQRGHLANVWDSLVEDAFNHKLDKLDEFMDEYGDGKYHKELEITEVSAICVRRIHSPRGTVLTPSSQVDGDADPPPTSSVNCRCGVANLVKKACINCVCSKWGLRCQLATCGCHGGPSCHNPFNHVDTQAIFGPEPVVLHGCFVTWVLKQKKVPSGRITRRFLFDLAHRTARGIEDVAPVSYEGYEIWLAKWSGISAAERDGPRGVELQWELNRTAFTKSKVDWQLSDVFYSFCRNDAWQHSDGTWHCRICGECMDWREWHCGKCNKCSDGVSLRCEGCKGVEK